MKKRVIILSLFVCLSSSIFAQSPVRQMDDKTLKELSYLANKLCECIVKIGSTRSGLTEGQRTYLKDNVVPHLFIKYDQRKMITTGGAYGTDEHRRDMREYFKRLQDQSRKQMGRERTYDLYPEFYTNQNGIVWLTDTIHEDGSIQEYAKLTIYQTYVLSTGNRGDMGYKKRVEVDAKEIRVLRILSDGTVKYGLGDVKRIERLNTYNR